MTAHNHHHCPNCPEANAVKAPKRRWRPAQKWAAAFLVFILVFYLVTFVSSLVLPLDYP